MLLTETEKIKMSDQINKIIIEKSFLITKLSPSEMPIFYQYLSNLISNKYLDDETVLVKLSNIFQNKQ